MFHPVSILGFKFQYIVLDLSTSHSRFSDITKLNKTTPFVMFWSDQSSSPLMRVTLCEDIKTCLRNMHFRVVVDIIRAQTSDMYEVSIHL